MGRRLGEGGYQLVSDPIRKPDVSLTSKSTSNVLDNWISDLIIHDLRNKKEKTSRQEFLHSFPPQKKKYSYIDILRVGWGMSVWLGGVGMDFCNLSDVRENCEKKKTKKLKFWQKKKGEGSWKWARRSGTFYFLPLCLDVIRFSLERKGYNLEWGRYGVIN